MIEQLTQDFIKKIIEECKKEENKTKIENQIIQPIINSISYKIQPYILISFTLYMFIVALIASILIFIVINRKK